MKETFRMGPQNGSNIFRRENSRVSTQDQKDPDQNNKFRENNIVTSISSAENCLYF